MAQFQDLTRVLLSAGGAMTLTGQGTNFLYTNDGNLTLKRYTGEKWADQETLAEGVRQGSPASYLLSPSTNLILYIDDSSTLRGLKYDDDDEEWVEDDTVPQQQLHEEGKLAACFLPNSKEKSYVFFQDPSKNLVCLDSTWALSILPASPLLGTPIYATIIDDKVQNLSNNSVLALDAISITIQRLFARGISWLTQA